jgi:FAD:protein FMN transferase
LLSFMLDMQGKTEGYFNPLMGNLTALWKAGLQAETPYVPDQSLIDQAVQDIADTKTNYLEIDGTTVTRHGVCTIDVGAVCKGWALKSIEHVFKENNSTDFIVDGGSSSFLFGFNAHSDYKDGTTKIEISNENGRYMRLKDTGLGTSGTSEQNATIGGVFYSHIVNPFTGSAIPNAKLSGAVGTDPAICDVLSTTFFLCGAEKTKEFASTFNVGYFFDDGTTFSNGNGLAVYGG